MTRNSVYSGAQWYPTLLLCLALLGCGVPVSKGLYEPWVVQLNGPWKFHVGDNAKWAAPDFDDSNWETVDLTPPAGAHDSDVGLSGYVPGWAARGHPGYTGIRPVSFASRTAGVGRRRGARHARRPGRAR